MPGRFKVEEMTPIQEAFMVGLTDQRVANLWAAADDWAELSPDAKNLLRNADKVTLKWLERASPEDVTQLQYSIKFMEASKLLGKVAWVTAAAICGGLITVLTLWDRIKNFLGTKT